VPGPEVRVRDHRNEGSSTDLSRNAGAALLLRKRHGEEVIKKFRSGVTTMRFALAMVLSLLLAGSGSSTTRAAAG